ncbi:MAG TPA: phage baseplate assembly protein V [Longimicrobiaceae bacterium]
MSILLDLLQAPAAASGGHVAGVSTGIVTNNQDPEKLGRVKVKFPWLSDDQESPWARVAVPMAGDGRGTWLLPEVGDEVLVAFERGDPGFPYVVGALWNKNAPPPETNEDGANDRRVLRSRSGHVVRLDDKDGEEKIEIVDKSEKNSIVVSTKDNTITVTCDGDLTLESRNGKLVLKGAKGVEVASDDAMKLEAQADVELKASGSVKVKGSTVELN